MPAGYIRRCTKCGHDDRMKMFKAAQDIRPEEGWACPNCAWTDYEIVATDDKSFASPMEEEERQEIESPINPVGAGRGMRDQ